MPTAIDVKAAPTLEEITTTWPATHTAAQCALALGVSKAQFYRLINRGTCPVRYVCVGRDRKVFLTASLVRVLSGEPDPQPPAPAALRVA
jgi:hypothetical protein